jgi:Na+-driven multidrug efflux pump
VDITNVGSHLVAIAVIVFVVGGTERVLTGSAIGAGDPSQAMVRAVLDALNRHVPSLRRTT